MCSCFHTDIDQFSTERFSVNSNNIPKLIFFSLIITLLHEPVLIVEGETPWNREDTLDYYNSSTETEYKLHPLPSIQEHVIVISLFYRRSITQIPPIMSLHGFTHNMGTRMPKDCFGYLI